MEGSAGVGFAIPSDIAQQIMASLISQGKVVRGQLGVVPDDLTPPADAVRAEGGRVPARRRPGQPRWQGRLAGSGHRHLVRWPTDPGQDQAARGDRRPAPGQRVDIGYVRDGEPATARATIAAPRPPAGGWPGDRRPGPAGVGPKLGVTVRDLTAHDRQSLNVPATTTGAFITGFELGQPGGLAGLGVAGVVGNGVVERVDRTPVNNKSEFDRAVAALPAGAVATLVILYPEDNQLHQSAFTVRL